MRAVDVDTIDETMLGRGRRRCARVLMTYLDRPSYELSMDCHGTCGLIDDHQEDLIITFRHHLIVAEHTYGSLVDLL